MMLAKIDAKKPRKNKVFEIKGEFLPIGISLAFGGTELVAALTSRFIRLG